MWEKNRHKAILITILNDIYRHPVTRTAVGFKGGTAASLVYGLPRLSVDLDFDLLAPDDKDRVFQTLNQEILPNHGTVIDAIEKRDTLFFLLTYEAGTRNVKIEISKRATRSSFEVHHYLGIPLLVIKKEDMAAGKLAALLTRKTLASRDLFDLWFFLKSGWTINETVIKERTGLTLEQALMKAEHVAKTTPKTRLLHGLGELLDDHQKQWVKENLQHELLFQLRLYRER